MATTLDLDIDAGGEFTQYITWYDEDGDRVDLTGYTAKLTIRDAGDATELLTIDDAGTDSRIDLEVDATQNDDFGEVAPDTTGVITLHIYATDTATLSGLAGVYDLILTPASGADHAIKLTKGSVTIDTLVTT
jgi:hypothetical protein